MKSQTIEYLKFACPKCASNKAYPVGHGMMRCRNCKFTAVLQSFRLEKRPGLRWGEAIDNLPNDNNGDAA